MHRLSCNALIIFDHTSASFYDLSVLRLTSEGILLDELFDVDDLYLLFQAALWNHVFGKALIHLIEHGGELPIEARITGQGEDVVPYHRIKASVIIRFEEDEAFSGLQGAARSERKRNSSAVRAGKQKTGYSPPSLSRKQSYRGF